MKQTVDSLFWKQGIQKYFEFAKQSLESVSVEEIHRCIELLIQAYLDRQQIFVFGNGGSASLASHFANDLGKGIGSNQKHRFRIISLNDNISLLTAISNDIGYNYVFLEQLRILMNKGDLVIGISTTGQSENVIRAFHYAEDYGAKTIAWTGAPESRVAALGHYQVTVNGGGYYGHTEDLQLMVMHSIVDSIKEAFERGFG